VDGIQVGAWYGNEPERKGFLFCELMEGVTHFRQWCSAVRAEFRRRVASDYRLADHVGEIWTSKPSPQGLGHEEWHGVRVGGVEYSHMVGTITGDDFDQRLEQLMTLHSEHRRTCAIYTAYGDR
jgi:hypothetical protein